MSDEVKKEDQPTAQVFRLVTVGERLEKQNWRNDDFATKVQKDLGPTGGKNPNGDAVQPNAFEPEDLVDAAAPQVTRTANVNQSRYLHQPPTRGIA